MRKRPTCICQPRVSQLRQLFFRVFAVGQTAWSIRRGTLSLKSAPQSIRFRIAALLFFDPDTYSGSNGLLDWLVASLGAQSQYKPGAGFAPSPMDANEQYR
jgi:hypothetical protein